MYPGCIEKNHLEFWVVVDTRNAVSGCLWFGGDNGEFPFEYSIKKG